MGKGPPAVGSDVASSGLAGSSLRRAAAEDVDRLKAVMADAFFEDPIFGWLMPDDTKRAARLRRYFAIELRHLALARGRVWTTSDLAGAALSLPPRRVARAAARHVAGGRRIWDSPFQGGEFERGDRAAPRA
jgi:hypothetical protein